MSRATLIFILVLCSAVLIMVFRVAVDRPSPTAQQNAEEPERRQQASAIEAERSVSKVSASV